MHSKDVRRRIKWQISKDLTIFLSLGLVEQFTSSINCHLRLQDLSMKFSYPATATFWDDSRAFLPTLSLGLCRTQSFARCNREVPASFLKCSEQASSHVITKSVQQCASPFTLIDRDVVVAELLKGGLTSKSFLSNYQHQSDIKLITLNQCLPSILHKVAIPVFWLYTLELQNRKWSHETSSYRVKWILSYILNH